MSSYGQSVGYSSPDPSQTSPHSEQAPGQYSLHGTVYGGVQEHSESGFEPGNLSHGLQSVQDQFQNRPISINSVLKDFGSTMDALGASDAVRSEVAVYLDGVSLQSQKDRPSVPFIKTALRTSADSLDGFITEALGQPSKVVRDWIDALLLQNIEFKAKAAAGGSSNTKVATEVAEEMLPSAPEKAYHLSDLDKATLKTLIQTARLQDSPQSLQQAQASIQQALGLLEGKNRPDLTGKFWSLQGRLLEKGLQQPEQALAAYANASRDFEQAKQPDKQRQALHAMARIHDHLGNLDQAASFYDQTLSLDRMLADTGAIAGTLNERALVSLRQGNHDEALQLLNQSALEASRTPDNAALLPSIFSNLGGAYRQQNRWQDAEKAYQVAVDHAVRLRDKTSLARTFQQMGGFYRQIGNEAKAVAVSQKLARLQTPA
ncbi:MAG: tetratricopeptide repeat protein [Cyanobacteria bacterium]|nr:tetratricopeptide repeat protein [Cyanobacteriota bacterium]